MAGENWPLVPLGELTENFDGRRVPVKENERKPGPYPYYGASGIVDRVDGYLFDGEYLLIGEDGENLRTRQTPVAFVATGKFWVNNHAHIVRGNHRADTRFLSYVLSQTEISGYLTGSTMPKLTQGNLNRLPVIAPPLAEQKAIAAVLGALDDKIELNRRMNATLEAMARALFQSWFIDFDPVRANLDRNQPSPAASRHPLPVGEGRGEGRFALDPATAALFPDSFQDSEAGHIPKGWEVRSLDKTAHYLNGLALQKYPPGDGPTLPVIKIAQLRKGDSVGADRCNTNLPPNYIVQDGDVLFSWSGSLEVELWCGGPGALNQHLFKVTSPEFPKWFYYLWTLYHLDEFRLIAADKATTMGHIQRGHLTAAKVLIPPSPLLDAMTRTMAPLIDQIIANRMQSRTLATLRDTLLPKLLSGEITTPAAE
jgi:type I restriction enzyme S subunit